MISNCSYIAEGVKYDNLEMKSTEGYSFKGLIADVILPISCSPIYKLLNMDGSSIFNEKSLLLKFN